jgi:hypothetical protein
VERNIDMVTFVIILLIIFSIYTCFLSSKYILSALIGNVKREEVINLGENTEKMPFGYQKKVLLFSLICTFIIEILYYLLTIALINNLIILTLGVVLIFYIQILLQIFMLTPKVLLVKHMYIKLLILD